MQPNKRIRKSTLALLALGMFGVGSVASLGLQASAQTPVVPATPVVTSAAAPVENSSGPDTDSIQDQANDGKPESANDAAEGPEASETGSVDADGPGGPQDEGVDAGTQDIAPASK